VEQEERDAYVKRYGKEALYRRDIHARFAVFASEKLQGTQSKEWGRFLELLMETGKFSDGCLDLVGNILRGDFSSQPFPVWRTLLLVPESDPRIGIATAIEMAGMGVDRRTKDVLSRSDFPVVTAEIEVKLCLATAKELTGKDSATRAEILDAIRHIGELCPAEVGPQLRVQYRDQPIDELLLVGMEPITDSLGDLHVFSVGHNTSGLSLGSHYDSSDSLWFGGSRWLFVPRG
jgi:hypothetical protein